ncbi:MAG TPA: peptidoglycan-binding domain-containing protein [Candidatus Angelobacter sp.]|nr:peptidoglycan-binding domain-containing protein [Candidatus Angelobacter sp.]
MRLAIKKLLLLSTLLALCAGYAPAEPQKASGKAAKHGHRHGKRRGAWKRKGQQAIKPDRAMEIQQALIREHYLSGEPTGVWDTRTQAALVKYQADNGWQTKVVPDSRALIKLGLGPNYSAQTLLNPSPASSAPAASASAASRGLNGGADKQ